MAKRPVFVSAKKNVEIKDIEFTWFPGFAPSQKVKSFTDLHENYKKFYPLHKILEVSSKSTESIGRALSAFNLIVNIEGKEIYFESLFQGSKVFENGGPFEDLLYETPIRAKRDSRLITSGDIISFRYLGKEWSSEPKTFFYDWIYIYAVAQKPHLLKMLVEYDAFTDIEFNPKKSLNCQAKAAALLATLYKENLLDDILSDPDKLKEFYNTPSDFDSKKQVKKTSDHNQLKLF